ncbi:DNA topoisomerase-1 [Hoeflea halophila]|uniref:DNA topoisomerase n=1 Tax=Hoeflea halophila TaxID=714899 RepID=A0A286IG05_9HYPH|nr:DNA topoisomerase IB [Hoeflea halophila]SOE18991.1 DNA topoisomerase-1 [Hoeflea halophila]
MSCINQHALCGLGTFSLAESLEFRKQKLLRNTQSCNSLTCAAFKLSSSQRGSDTALHGIKPTDKNKIAQAELIYVTDAEPGITRQRRGRGYRYLNPNGTPVTESIIRDRIKRLGVPPAYTNVWICPSERGHIQATGHDARGRKQYRYHEDWQALRNEAKFSDLLRFGQKLPQIRRVARADAERLEDRERAVLGALILLLDAAYLRVGNRQYLEENGTYGATTLLKRHVTFGDRIELRFLGKGGRRMQRSLKAPRLQRTLERIADLPGKQLFGWEDEEGQSRGVDSGQLNQHLAAIGGPGVSAKVFRTWGGTLAAFETASAAIRRGEVPTIRTLCESAASELANTVAVCRKSYVHPQVLALATDEELFPVLDRQLRRKVKAKSQIGIMEQRLLTFLRSMQRRKAAD